MASTVFFVNQKGEEVVSRHFRYAFMVNKLINCCAELIEFLPFN